MKMPLADILDRLSILYLKQDVGGQDVAEEIATYEAAAVSCRMEDRVPHWLIKLVAFNALVWSAESDIRRELDLPLAEVGRRALNIREFNKLRIEVKNEIAAACGNARETKVNHGSA